MSLQLRKAEADFFKCERYNNFLKKMKEYCPSTELVVDLDSIKALTGQASQGTEKKAIPIVLFGFLTGFYWTAIDTGFFHVTKDPLGKETVAAEIKKLTFKFIQDDSITKHNYQFNPVKGTDKQWTMNCVYNWTFINDSDITNNSPSQKFDSVLNKLLTCRGTTLQIAKAERDYAECTNFKNFQTKFKTYCPATELIPDNQSVRDLKFEVNFGGPIKEPISFCIFKMWAGYFWMTLDAAFYRLTQDKLVKETIESDIKKIHLRVKQDDSISIRGSFKWLIEKGSGGEWSISCVYNWNLFTDGDVTNSPVSDIQAQLMNML